MEGLDLFKEVLFVEDGVSIQRDRYQLPLFFIVGGADDEYLSRLMGISVTDLHQLIQSRSVDNTAGSELRGVFTSRSELVNSETFARTFPLSQFLEPVWPILRDIQDKTSLDVKTPSTIEQTWIV